MIVILRYNFFKSIQLFGFKEPSNKIVFFFKILDKTSSPLLLIKKIVNKIIISKPSRSCLT